MKEIVVTAKDINIYETIKSEDLKTIEVPEVTNTDGFFTSATDIIGKVSKVPLSSNDLIYEGYLINKDKISGVSFITINTNYAKTGGAKAGDLVDIYKANLEKGDWVDDNQSSLIAENVIVLDLTTVEGKGLGKDSKIPLGGGEKLGAIKLGGDIDEIKKLVPASALVENGYVLVVKNSLDVNIINKDKNLEKILEKENEEGEEEGEIDSDEAIHEGEEESID